MGTRSNLSEGESSSGVCSPMDCVNGEVPPKKVRCTWQIRGKYHSRAEGRAEEPQRISPSPVIHEEPEPPSYLQIWQVQQMGRSYIDNMMNRALENAHGGPNLGEGSVEDTAVLAAIHNHGLHVQSRCPPPHLCSTCVCPTVPPSRSNRLPPSQPLEHTTFMDAAVTAAIQRKGLSSLSAADM